MCACLNLIPVDMVIRVMDRATQTPVEKENSSKVCYLAHEIGAGSYYAYVWGKQAMSFFELQTDGHMIASNMHADTLGQMHTILFEYNQIPRELVDAVTLKLFLRMRRTSGGVVHRWISHVYENDGKEDRLIWVGKEDGSFVRVFDSRFAEPSTEKMWRQFITSCQKRKIKKIEDIRRILIGYMG
jgi:hypothetical protein